MDLHEKLIARAEREVVVAWLIAGGLGAASLLIVLSTWKERGYLDFQIIFGIADALVVMALAIWLRRRKITPAVLLIALGVVGIGYMFREGAPLIATVPTLIAIAFYARAVSALRYLNLVRTGQPG